jgi:hypothetical protein
VKILKKKLNLKKNTISTAFPKPSKYGNAKSEEASIGFLGF